MELLSCLDTVMPARTAFDVSRSLHFHARRQGHTLWTGRPVEGPKHCLIMRIYGHASQNKLLQLRCKLLRMLSQEWGSRCSHIIAQCLQACCCLCQLIVNACMDAFVQAWYEG